MARNPELERIPAIIGVGSAVPPRIKTNEDIDIDLGVRPGTTDRLMRRTRAGVVLRHWVEPGEQTTSDLAAEALLEALEMAGIDKTALKSIVLGTDSADYGGVAAAAMIQHRLGLATNVRAYDVLSGCTGWAQALKNVFTDLTSSYGDRGPQAAIGAEVLTPVLSKKEKLVYPLFGDGGGATVVDLVIPDSADLPKPVIRIGSDGKYAEDLYMPAGGSKIPTSLETVRDGKHALFMNPGKIEEQAILRMAEFARLVLKEANLPVEEVTWLIPHQANESIMHNVADALNVPWEKVLVTIDKFGNTSAASIPMAMAAAIEEGKLKRNDNCAFAVFGAGLTFAGGILPMVGLPKK